jgi:hypothetical protein
MTTTVVVLLIETHGKQEFLFSSGKRRESVGASQLIVDVPGWARELVAEPDGTIDDDDPVEILLAAAGTFLALCKDSASARGIVAAVTRRALSEAAGLGVTGVVGEPFQWNSGAASDAIRAAFALMADARVAVAPPAVRFPVLPVTALCPSSALPAAAMVRVGKSIELRSAVSAGKWRAAEHAWGRLAEDSGLSKDDVRQAIQRLDGDEDGSPARVAIVHADGDGLGAIIANLGTHLLHADDPTPDSTFAAAYRAFSDGLDTASKNAFRAAVRAIATASGRTPDVLPLVLGGDDLTFIADAAIAPTLTRTYLTTFVELAARISGVADPVRRINGGDPRLGVSAGIVIVPPHFPFAAGYRLTEALVTDIAKQAKTAVLDVKGDRVPCVSLAAHVHLDSTPGTVDQLLENLAVIGGLLTAAPYVEQVEIPGAPTRELPQKVADWLAGRAIDSLWTTAATLSERDTDGRRRFPSTQVHELRARLRPDRKAACEYLDRLIAANPAWRALDPLFTERAEAVATTMLLDAMALAPFLTITPSEEHADA